jgi:hypothetical protein
MTMSEDKFLLWLEKCPRCNALSAVYEVDGKPGQGHIREHEKIKAAEATALVLKGYDIQEFTGDVCHSCHWFMKYWGRKWR